MKHLHVVGRKNHGKTSLVADLVSHWTSLGFRVGTIKHTHHRHELDTPGKDSYRHREAGAEVVGILSPTMNAVFWKPADLSSETDPYGQFAPLYAGCDFVLVEGHSGTTAPKIEIWRANLDASPLAEQDASILAVVTDDPLPLPTTVLRRADVPQLARWIEQNVWS